ncbi:MAG: glucosamine-6-phosphate deaminase [Erysipelotrichales bacterium]|nr:glucosamine-6-phosphate deaminase [Erysipelotrichales bacterium]
MKIIIKDNYNQMCEEASKVMKEVILKEDVILGLATGSTPIGLYKLLVEDHKTNKTSYKKIQTVNLDEYVGIPQNHEQSYFTFMHEQLFNHVDIDPKNINLPRGDVKDLNKECQRYNELLAKKIADIQLLGIGGNGHIGFNEPGTAFDSVTYITDLQEKTIQDNSRFFDKIEDVPTKAITMGIANIMAAKKILLLASGVNKAEAIKELVLGDININCPATVLRNHPDVVIIVDKDAASLL